MIGKSVILGYCVFAGSVFFIGDLRILAGFSLVFTLLIIFLPYGKLKRGVVPISFFLLTTFFANCLFSKGRIILNAGPLTITEEGLHIAAIRTLRVFMLIAGAKFINLYMTLERMISALGDLFSPLEKLGVPVRNFFETMALAAKALPVIGERLSSEYRSQMNTPGQKGIRDRIAIVFTFLLPVFFQSIDNPEALFVDEPAESSNDVSMASERV